MLVYRYLFINTKGRVSFWECSDGTLRPRTIHSEASRPVGTFWDEWKSAYGMSDEDFKDILVLSDDEAAISKVPSWVLRCSVVDTCWSKSRLSELFASEDRFRFQSISINGSLVWNGGDISEPLSLFAVSSSGEVKFPMDKVNDCGDGRRQTMKVFLEKSAEHCAENDLRCKSLR